MEKMNKEGKDKILKKLENQGKIYYAFTIINCIAAIFCTFVEKPNMAILFCVIAFIYAGLVKFNEWLVKQTKGEDK